MRLDAIDPLDRLSGTLLSCPRIVFVHYGASTACCLVVDFFGFLDSVVNALVLTQLRGY